MLVRTEAIVISVAVYWGLSRGWNSLNALGDRRKPKLFWNVFTDIFAVLMVGAGLLTAAWSDIVSFADRDAALWALALTPFAFYFYLVWRFAVWRWRRYRSAEGGKPLHLSLKPQSPLSWIIYAWFGLWIAWQVCHAWAPSLIPSWLS